MTGMVGRDRASGRWMRTPEALARERRARAKATNYRRHALRKIGVRASVLDGIASGYLHAWARGQARLDMIECGEIESEDYWRAHNSVTRSWRLFESRVKELGIVAGKAGPARGARLQEYLSERNGGRA